MMPVLNLTKQEAYALYTMVDLERGSGAVSDAQDGGHMPLFDCNTLLAKIAWICPDRDEIAASFKNADPD